MLELYIDHIQNHSRLEILSNTELPISHIHKCYGNIDPNTCAVLHHIIWKEVFDKIHNTFFLKIIKHISHESKGKK